MAPSAGGIGSSQYSGDQSASNSAALASDGSGGLTVTGYGTATAPRTAPSSSSTSRATATPTAAAGPTPAPERRVTEETLQPIVDSLVAVGVSADDIEFEN